MAPDSGSAVLELRAEDADDLAVISACLQDALIPVRDLAFDPVDRTFVFVANRFRWENGLRTVGGNGAFERTLCGIAFGHVTAVSYSGFRRADGARILPLLAIRTKNEAVYLDFSGGASIKLEVSRILCHARDLGEPWPTPWQPRHDLDGPA
jgi:hypothetical protein